MYTAVVGVRTENCSGLCKIRVDSRYVVLLGRPLWVWWTCDEKMCGEFLKHNEDGRVMTHGTRIR